VVRTTLFAVSVVALSGCTLLNTTAEFDDGVDAGPGPVDAGPDAGQPDDGGRDGGPPDAGPVDFDAGPDAGLDAGTDAGPPPRIVDFSVGPGGACVIDDRARLSCWGSNLLGGLATGDVAAELRPVSIDLGAGVQRLSAGLATCAQTAAPATYCWGGNEHGMVGDGATLPVVTVPFELTAFSSSGFVETGPAVTCVSSIASTTTCWGRNTDGELAHGAAGADQTTPGSPVTDGVSPLMDIVEFGIGNRFTCFRSSGRELFCAGNNLSGQLGQGTTTPSSVALPVMLDVDSVAAAGQAACAVSGGDVYCWGDNTERIVHPGSADPVLVPTLVPMVGPAVEVVVGRSFACARTTGNEVRCWGTRATGALGDGAPTGSEFSGPVTVSGLSNVVALDANLLNAVCALTSDAELFCWGEDGTAELGGPPIGGQTLFLDGNVRHFAPMRVDPL